MRTARITFEDGNTLTTQMNATKQEIEKYYLGKSFQFGDTEECPHDKMLKAVKVEHVETFKASFIGRKAGAIGIVYPITAEVNGFTEEDANLNLYKEFEHIRNLKLTKI